MPELTPTTRQLSQFVIGVADGIIILTLTGSLIIVVILWQICEYLSVSVARIYHRSKTVLLFSDPTLSPRKMLVWNLLVLTMVLGMLALEALFL